MMSTPAVPPDAGAVYRRYLSAVLLHGQASARACDLGATDLYALNILELRGAMTPGELGDRAGLTTGPTTRLIDRLEAAGYVRRTPSPDDRRKVIVEPVGKPAQLDEVMTPAREKVGEILRGYTPEQLQVLFDYFSRATTAYQEATEDLRD
ncbi:MarR family winged helix-turn-helix transcriptional regulator [Sphaerisporangium fuscum]|uniref:MarR family winged helix-turn-helix transcriptional regulator n=1 Tax=Sphaerisporangium fuscum TaxID=2835868 RepID=UPI0020299986|nr:MarR family transcriptional regulator [Sphaerisporangium fuscum]